MKKLLLAFLLFPSVSFARNGTVFVIDKIAPKNGAFVGVVDSSQTVVSTFTFSKNLSGADTNVQHALQTIDQLSLSSSTAGNPGGSQGQFQFNSTGTFAGSAMLTTNYSTLTIITADISSDTITLDPITTLILQFVNPNKLLATDSNGHVISTTTTGGGTSPGGSDSNVQINHPSGTFYGDNGFQYDVSVSSLTLSGKIGITDQGNIIQIGDGTSDPNLILNNKTGTPSGGVHLQSFGIDKAIFGQSTGQAFISVSTSNSSIPTNRILFQESSPAIKFTNASSIAYIEFNPIGGSTFSIPVVISTLTINNQLLDSSLSAGTSGFFLMSRGSMAPQWNAIPTSGGGGSSSLAVGTGTASSFNVATSSPTSNLGFNGTQFNVLGNGSTSQVSINGSSVTLSGTLVAGSNITLTPSGGITTIAASGSGSGGIVSPGTFTWVNNSFGINTSTISVSTLTITNLSPGVMHIVLGSSNVATGLVSMSTETIGAFISSVNVSAALSVTGNGLNNTAITISMVSSSATLQGVINPIYNQSTLQSGATSYPQYSYIGSSETVSGTITASTITLSNGGSGSMTYLSGLPGISVSTSTQINGVLTVISLITAASTITNGLEVGNVAINAGNMFQVGGGTLSVTSSGHVETKGAVPLISACGATPNGSVVGNDHSGKITIGGGIVTSCTMTFANTWTNPPSCTVLPNTAVTSGTGSTTTTVFTLGAGATFAGDIIMYNCGDYQ